MEKDAPSFASFFYYRFHGCLLSSRCVHHETGVPFCVSGQAEHIGALHRQVCARGWKRTPHRSPGSMNTDVVDGGVLMNVGWRDRKRWTVRWRSKDEPYRGERAFKRKRGFVRKPGTVLVHHGAVPPYRTRSYALGSPRSRPRERMSLKTQILGR